mgnify:FL=1
MTRESDFNGRLAQYRAAKSAVVSFDFRAGGLAGEPYRQSMEALRESRERLIDLLAMIPSDDFGVLGRASDGRTALLTRSAQQPGHYQLTRFDGAGQPWGDAQYEDLRLGLKALLEEAPAIELPFAWNMTSEETNEKGVDMTAETIVENSDEFFEKYKPVANTLGENYLIEQDGVCVGFETFGADLDFVRKADPKHVWTLIDCDNTHVISAGFQTVNRLAYFVTQEPWVSGNEQYIDVVFDDDPDSELDDSPSP